MVVVVAVVVVGGWVGGGDLQRQPREVHVRSLGSKGGRDPRCGASGTGDRHAVFAQSTAHGDPGPVQGDAMRWAEDGGETAVRRDATRTASVLHLGVVFRPKRIGARGDTKTLVRSLCKLIQFKISHELLGRERRTGLGLGGNAKGLATKSCGFSSK